MCGHNLTIKFPPDLRNYTELNGLWIPSPNLPLLNQINWFKAANHAYWKKEKKSNIMWEVVTRRCSARTLSWKYYKIYREMPVLESLSKNAVVHKCSIKSLRPATLLKKRLWYRSFPVNFAKFLRTPSHTEHLRWLLLFLILLNGFRPSGLQRY